MLGALVISLDFELLWGVHDTIAADGGYRENLLGAREAIPRMLDLFAEFEVAATWATVGFLFAEGRDELESFSPEVKPTYRDERRDPYKVNVGSSEKEDPISFAPSLIRMIASAPHQELASHTFSHYYCLDAGQTMEQFRADLDAAMAIATAKGYTLRTLVVPRHQVRRDYFPAIEAAGFTVHRTQERNFLSTPSPSGSEPIHRRALRLIDSYVSVTGPNDVSWDSTAVGSHGLHDIRESRFLRPLNMRFHGLEPLRTQRIVNAMKYAATNGSIFHLWWHPHNFGRDLQQNLVNLRRILEKFRRLNQDGLMNSYTMAEAADAAASIGKRHAEPA